MTNHYQRSDTNSIVQLLAVQRDLESMYNVLQYAVLAKHNFTYAADLAATVPTKEHC